MPNNKASALTYVGTHKERRNFLYLHYRPLNHGGMAETRMLMIGGQFRAGSPRSSAKCLSVQTLAKTSKIADGR